MEWAVRASILIMVTNHQLILRRNLFTMKSIQSKMMIYSFNNTEKSLFLMLFQWIMDIAFNLISNRRIKCFIHLQPSNGSQMKNLYLSQLSFISIRATPSRISQWTERNILLTEFIMIWKCTLFQWMKINIIKINLLLLLLASYFRVMLQNKHLQINFYWISFMEVIILIYQKNLHLI